MEQPISTTYLNYQVARAAAALPAAGAYDGTPTELDCQGFDVVTLFIEYTRGAVGGKVKLKAEVSPVTTGDHWYTYAMYNPEKPAAAADYVAPFQRQIIEYAATGAAIEKVMLPAELLKGVERIRIACAESGVVGSPGTCKVIAKFANSSL